MLWWSIMGARPGYIVKHIDANGKLGILLYDDMLSSNSVAFQFFHDTTIIYVLNKKKYQKAQTNLFLTSERAWYY